MLSFPGTIEQLAEAIASPEPATALTEAEGPLQLKTASAMSHSDGIATP